MNEIILFLRKTFTYLWLAILGDYHNIYLSFPDSYPIIYILIRVIPICLLGFWLLNILRESKNGESLSPVFTFPQYSPRVLVLLFLLGFLLRYYFIATTDPITYGTDAAARFMQAKEWYQNPQGVPGGLIWLPLYHLLIIALAPFGLDVSLSGRISILLLSALSVPLLYSVVRKVFNSQTAFWSAFLLAVNPFHIRYSSLYLSENMFLFFVLAAFYFLTKFQERGKFRYLMISALLVNCASMLRYEGWLIAGLFPFYLFMNSKNIKSSVRYFIMNCICLLIYCWFSYKQRGMFIFGLYVSDMDVQAELAQRSDKWAHIFSRLSSEFVFPIWVYFLMIAGVVYGVLRRIKPAYLFLWVTLFSFTAYKVLTFTSQPFWRYFATALFMLLPYAAIWLVEVSRNSRRNFAFTACAVVVFSLPSLFESYRQRQELSYAPADYKQACSLLKAIRNSSEKVIVNIWIAGIDYSSFQEDVDIHRDMTFQPMNNWAKEIFTNYREFSDKQLVEVIHDTSFHYIFVQKGLVLDSILYSNTVTRNLFLKQTRLDTLYNSEAFQLLKIRRARNQ